MHEADGEVADDEEGPDNAENSMEGSSSPKTTGAGEKLVVSGEEEDEQSGVSRVGSSLPKEKVCILTSGNEDSSEPPNLWFSATNLVEEDEASNSDSRRNHGNNTSERNDGNLRTGFDAIVHRPNLGFGGAPSIRNNGGRASSPFNFYEFPRLAHANLRFGREATNRCFLPPVKNPEEPELARGLRRAIRCLVPASRTEGMTGFHGGNSNSAVRKQQIPVFDGLIESAADISPGNDDVSPITAADVSPATADISPMSADDIMTASSFDISHGIHDDVVHNSPISPLPSGIPTRQLVGNIPLHTCPDLTTDDKIAHAFNNSTRKTLSYVAPIIQNGEVVVRPTLATIRNGSTRWKTTDVGYFLGKKPYFHHVKEFALSIWPGLREVKATINRFFFFQFKTVAHMEEIIEGGP
ncbi:UNVERIFIED_CONTAM: hypothetical protein Sindi_1264500 [Sesamum indicum]